MSSHKIPRHVKPFILEFQGFVVVVAVYCFFSLPQHKRGLADIDGKQVCGCVSIKAMCLPVASQSGSVQKVVMLFTVRTEGLCSRDISPGQRVELNSGAQAWSVFSTTQWSWFLEAGHNLPSLWPVLWPLPGGDLKAWCIF